MTLGKYQATPPAGLGRWTHQERSRYDDLTLAVAALITLALLALTSLACGPTAGPGNEPQSSSGGTASSEEAAPTPTSPPPADTPTPLPTKEIPTPLPTKPRTPTPTPPPTAVPDPEHPMGLDGCRQWTLFSPPEEMKYQVWCGEEVTQHLVSACSGMDTTEAELSCARDALADFRSFPYEAEPWKCVAISDVEDRGQCAIRLDDDISKTIDRLLEAWAKVRIRADSDPEVVSAMKDTLSCIEELGHEDVNPDLLFNWQRMDSPAARKEREEGLTQAEKDLRSDWVEPSKSCAKKNGLYDAQDTAWAAELE